MNESIERIKRYKERFPQLCHASNILKKYDDGQKIDQLQRITERYIPYLEANLDLIGYSDEIIRERVALLNDYYNFIHENDYDNLFSSQGKFRPTILEEFLFLLFKDFVTEYQDRLNAADYLESGSVKA